MARILVVLLLLVPQVAAAQDRPLKIRQGQQVWVTTDQGPIAGAVESISADEVRIDGETVRRASIVRIDVRDSPREGALIGAAVAGALALSAGPLCVETHSCTWAPNIIALGIGAGVGALIDRKSPRKTVFHRRVSIAPSVTPRALGVTVSLSR